AGDIPGAKLLGLTPRALVDASNRYLAAHPAMARWRVQTAAEAQRTRVSRTFTGRRRRLLGDGRSAIREAYNHPMQGGVADILNLATVQIANRAPWATLVYTCHDAAWWAGEASRSVELRAIIEEVVTQEWEIGNVRLAIPVKFKSERVSKVQ
ncbi:MAG TPA: DNA polymerase, partial [Candidatus Paceibacterota bacterium]